MGDVSDSNGISVANVDCPGTRYNFLTLVSEEWKCRYGISALMNTGECDLFISPLDSDGQPVEDGKKNVMLSPGQTIPHYYPPTGTHQIVVVCSKECNGKGRCQFQSPNA